MRGCYRRNRVLLALTIVVLLVVRVNLGAQDPPSPRAEDLLTGTSRQALLGDYLESLRVQAGIRGLAGAIVGERDILWERAFGQQDIERSIATRTDTPFHLDGLTELLTTSLVLRCVEEGQLSLGDQISRFDPTSPDATATVWQILTHTSGAPDSPVFAYRPERFGSLASLVQICTGSSFRASLSSWLDRLAMIDSVPGPDAIHVVPPTDGMSASDIERYTAVLDRLAVPYAVDRRGRASVSRYTATTLTPAGGLISTVRDFAKFDLALKSGVFLRPDTLEAAWRAPLNRDGQPLPHSLGWFVQTYNGETIVWQFGVSDNASSSLVVMVPARGLTFVLMANSDGLVKPFGLATGDLMASPFGRLFLGVFVR